MSSVFFAAENASLKPMVSTLFPKHFSLYSSTASVRFYFSNHDPDDLKDAFAMVEATGGGRVSDLTEIIRDSGNERERIYLPYRVGNTSLLYEAARAGHANVVKLLLDSFGHDPNQGNRFGSSPLEIASMMNHGNVVFLLLTHGGRLTSESLVVAAQWNATSSLSAMYLAGGLKSLEDIDLLYQISKYHKHTTAMDLLVRMRELSRLELAAELIDAPAVKWLCGNKDPSVIINHEVLKSAMMYMNKSKLKLTKGIREFRECKEAMTEAQKRVGDMCKALVAMRIVVSNPKTQTKGKLLALECPKGFRILNELLGLVMCDRSKDERRIDRLVGNDDKKDEKVISSSPGVLSPELA